MRSLREEVDQLLESAETPELRARFARRTPGREEERLPGDGFIIRRDASDLQRHSLLSRFLEEETRTNRGRYWNFSLKCTHVGQQISEMSREDLIRLVRAAVVRCVAIQIRLTNRSKDRLVIIYHLGLLSSFMKAAFRRRLPTTHDDCWGFVAWLDANLRDEGFAGYGMPVEAATKAIVNHVGSGPIGDDLIAGIEAIRAKMSSSPLQDFRQIGESLARAISGTDRVPIDWGEAWADQALADIKAAGEENRQAWAALISHAQTATASKPGSRWTKTAKQLVDTVGRGAFFCNLAHWFRLVDRPRTAPIPHRHNWHPNQNELISDKHSNILRGLCWMAAEEENAEVARALCALAISAYRKIPGVGPRAVKIGNAAVYALGRMPGRDALAQLALLKVKVKFGSAQKQLEKAFTAAAEREGLPLEEIEEMAVPAYGLTEVGRRAETLNDFTAELVVTGTGSTEIRWTRPDGKPQKSVPKPVKENCADDLKDLKAAAKDIERMLPAQRDRIDSLFLGQKTWAFPTWAERYLDHPLIGTLARRLIWVFDHGADRPQVEATWLEDRLVDGTGRPVKVDESSAIVSLWHPIGRPAADVLKWRKFFESREIRQPLKQAHREVYLLTDAERNTRVYSNRYAAHVLRQHQFNALCAARGWKNRLRLMVDDEYPPATRGLPQWNLRAEFWVEGAGDEYGADTNDAGVYLYLTTDQVRFFRLDAATQLAHAGGGGYRMAAGGPGQDNVNEPVLLSEIPALVLSEIMRDVDLFVGVASVGNNPQWSDGGPDGRYGEYWHRFSFGDLTATAQTRRDVLKRLLPRLKIASCCELDEKFLKVRGRLRTYKIHLGSSNILMEPNDQYLCIVQSRGQGDRATGKVFLPFEGDQQLAVILSKAFLLADDAKITDPTILSQLRS